MKRNIEIGEIYGDYKVIEDLGVNKSRHHYYKCVCQICNKTSNIKREKLLSDKPFCYSCRRGKHIGKIINGYKVESLTGTRSLNRYLIYRCRCTKCGRVEEVSSTNLTNQNIPECVCKYNDIKPDFLEQILI